MIEVVAAPEHVAAFRLEGTLTAGDYERMFGEIEERLRKHERIGVFADARELRGITPRALARDVGYGLGKLGEYGRFARGAVVTDRPWLRALAKVGDRVVRRTEVRAFGSGEREAALAWVSEVRDEPRVPALRLIPTTRGDTVAFAWNGRVSSADVAEVVRAIDAVLEEHDHIRLLARIERFDGIVPGALSSSGLLALKRRARDRVDRYAVIGGPGWLKHWIRSVKKVFGVDVRWVPASEEPAAWRWIDAQPVEQPSQSA